ncbi:MAG TPA: hypothetical protein EYM68_02895, partial [Gammaproteobacteria bacterium]|nr:hypothetical protein [Gammaproteobacteria bacterium]
GHAQESPGTKKALVIGSGPAGLEYARVAAARGHTVTVLEGKSELGGHVRLQSLLPSRSEFGEIARWLADQATKNGAELRTDVPVSEADLENLLENERPDHVVLATGSSVCSDGFEGWTGESLPGWESGNCIGWDEVLTALSRPTGASFPGDVVVIDDMCDVVAPLTAVALTKAGANSVTLLTRWPMVGMETILDVYLDWILPKLYESGVTMLCDHFVRRIAGAKLQIYNVHHEKEESELVADWIVMAIGRRSETDLLEPLKKMGISVEAIGDATAPRSTYEAVYEGHRQARKL